MFCPLGRKTSSANVLALGSPSDGLTRGPRWEEQGLEAAGLGAARALGTPPLRAIRGDPPACLSGSPKEPHFSVPLPSPSPPCHSESSREPERERARRAPSPRSPGSQKRWWNLGCSQAAPLQLAEVRRPGPGGRVLGFGLRTSVTDPVTLNAAFGNLSFLFYKTGIMVPSSQARVLQRPNEAWVWGSALKHCTARMCPRFYYYNTYEWESKRISTLDRPAPPCALLSLRSVASTHAPCSHPWKRGPL